MNAIPFPTVGLRLAAAIMAVLMAAGTASAHPAESITDEAPRARIRGDVRQQGLSPSAFARWIGRRPALAVAKVPGGSIRRLTRTGSEPPLAAEAFAAADLDYNGRISANELADYLTRRSARSKTARAGPETPITP